MSETNINKNKLNTLQISPINTPEKKSNEKPISKIDPNFTIIFRSIQKEINESDINEKEKNDLMYILNTFEAGILFFHTYVDNSLPIYSIINSYFVNDILFICVVELIIFNQDVTYTKHNFTSYDTLKNTYNIRNIKLDSNVQKGGGIKASISTLLNHFNETINIDNLVNTETEKLSTPGNYELPNTLMTEIENSMASSINNNILTTDNTELNNKIYNIINNLYNKEYNKINPSLKNSKNKYLSNMNNGRKEKYYRDEFSKILYRFYDKIIASLRNKYKSNKDVQFYKEEESTAKKISPGGIEISNKILSIISRGVLDYTRPEYKKHIKKDDGFQNMYEGERKSILQIAKEGIVPSKLDDNLIADFNKCLKNDYKNKKQDINKNNAVNVLSGLYTKKPYIINNAMTVANADKKRIIDILFEQGFKPLCPISSILDAQGGLGSCRSGKLSQGYVSSPINIYILGGEADNGTSTMEMNFEIPKGVKGNYILSYYAMYDELNINDCQINAVIADSVLTILSASNTFETMLDHIERRFQKNNNSSDWSIFDRKTDLENLIKVGSRKMIGDFLQELNAIVENGGFVNNEPVYNDKILLTQNDQPSTVRSSYLLLHKETTGDINRNSAITYITPSRGYLYHNNLRLTGGQKRKTKKKIQINKHNNTKKNKKKYEKQPRFIRNKNTKKIYKITHNKSRKIKK